MEQMTGRSGLVTGAARGMGRAHALRLAHEGADLVLIDAPGPVPTADYPMASEDELEATAEAVEAAGGRVIAMPADVRSQADLNRAVAAGIGEFGKIDFLVANAGIWGQLAPITTMSEEAWRETLDINLTGEWRSIKAVAQHMIERRSGSIVLISSISGLEGQPLSANYASAKHGLIGLMRTAALELGPYNIRCNAVCPGFINTPIHHWQAAYDLFAGRPGGTTEDRESAARYYGILAGRGPLDPSHVSNAVLFLLSDSAGEITGHTLPVDSGHTVLPHYNPAPVDL